MRPIPFPALHEETLASGARVVVARRPGVPLAAVRLVVEGGASLDPAGRHGLAHLVALSARRGTRRRTGRQVDAAVEALGAEMGAACDEDAAFFGLSAPAEHLGRLLDLVVEVATAPSFPEAEVRRLRRRELATLANLLDEPGAVADRALLGALYAGHAYGHPADGRVAHVRRLGRADAAAFHARWYGPGVATLVVVGAVEPEAAFRLARRHLGRWRAAGAAPPVVPPPPPVPRSVLVVDKPELTQTQLRIGCAGLPRRSPDFFAAQVANAAFGGGFTSRLVEAVRVNRGLSYGVRSRYAMSRAGGAFLVSSFTKNESAAELVAVALEEARRFAEEGPTAEELDRAQAWLCGLFPLSLETHDQVAERIADLRIYGLPATEITGYRDAIRAVDAAACRRVARATFPLDRGAIVAVGPGRALARALGRFGPVKVVAPGRLV